jgi:hypothetical protein
MRLTEQFNGPNDYLRALAGVADQAERFHRAALGKLSAEENAAAWREFSELAVRALRTCRLWDPEYVQALAPVFLAAIAEQREIERVERELAEAGEDKAEIRKVTSVIRGLTTLAAADAKAEEFEEDPEGARRVAGYLDFDAQPTAERRSDL